MRLKRAEIKSIMKDRTNSLKELKEMRLILDLLSRRRFSSRNALEGQFWGSCAAVDLITADS